MPAYRATMPRDNIVKLYCGLFGLPLLLCLYGLLLPTDWARHFGALAGPIRLAGQLVPAVGKFTASSANPELMAGFMGLAVYMPPLLGLWLCRWALFDLREPECPRLILTPPYHPAWLWVFLWFFAGFSIWLFYAPPNRDFADPRNAYDRAVVAVLGSRMFIAVCGAFVTTVCGVAFACVFGFPVRLWARMTGREQQARSA